MRPNLKMTLLLAAALAMVCGNSVLADAPLEGTKPAQWRLVWTTDPATSARLIWNPEHGDEEHAVRMLETIRK